MSRFRALGVLALLVLCMLVSACGGSLIEHPGGARAQNASVAAPGAVAVIRDWARELRAGNVRAAARLFSLPSVFANGSGPVSLRSEHDVLLANASLSCGAQLLSVTPIDGLLHAVFRLTNRPGPGGGCGAGVGQEGAADFLIAAGHISHWLRAPIHEAPARHAPAPSPDAQPV